MSYENPSAEPTEPKGLAPLNITIDDLYTEPSNVSRERFAPAERAAFDLAAFVTDALEPGYVDGRTPTEISYTYNGTSDFLTPDKVIVDTDRLFNSEDSDFISYRIRLGESPFSPIISAMFVTDFLPSVTDPTDSEEVIRSFSLDFSPDGNYTNSFHVASDKPAETDAVNIELFQNTVARIQAMMAVDYEPVIPD